MSNEEGRPPAKVTGPPSATPIVPAGPDKWARRRGVRAQREATAELRQLLDIQPVKGLPNGCARHHDGPCDYWGACTGMNQGLERYAPSRHWGAAA